MSDITTAATQLANAFTNHRLLTSLPDSATPQSFEESYTIQKETLIRTGKKIEGWKLAVATPAAQAKLGIDGPLIGPILAGHVVENGGEMPASRFHFPNIEAEIVLIIGATPPADVSIATIGQYVASARLAIEIADRRFVEKPSPMVTLADLNATGYLVVGDEITGWRKGDFTGGLVETWCNDTLLARNDDPGQWPDPLAGLVYLVGFLAKRGEYLKPGDVITTGACATPTLAASGVMEARFDGLGTVRFTLRPE
ncbi:2-keto-4-pentenoate hydratase [Thalassospira sp.]|uniref:2-keto-4-pentenoate hydratase n=1 Tax=Thalassospira sp. TaxID=1912094 RepID=UPI002733BD96|nr:fumarylacetoacetate hydrolase family protein [Thalassospira sp.]MDP2696989.1 fumarylacetoacetate hydrolase family protein [Thalassospira sp.]